MPSFAKATNGNFAVITALAVVPLVASVGLAVDYYQVEGIRSKLQNATDAAALAAAAKSSELTKKELKSLIEKMGEANSAAFQVNRNIKFQQSIRTDEVEVVGTADVKNTFMLSAMGGKTKVSATSIAVMSSKPTEVVLAVDLTNSMNFGTTWANAQNAMNQMFADLSAASSLTVGIVPFTDRVNIGSLGSAQEWLTTSSEPAGWTGCVEPREIGTGAFPYGVDDARPENSFVPSHPDYWGGVMAARNYDCGTQILLPTGSMAQVQAKISELRTFNATGRIDEGLAFAWRMMSPKWRGKWGKPAYPGASGDVNKRAILITDGRTSVNEYEYDKKRTWAWNQGSKVMFEHIANTCSQMKANGIEVAIIQLAGNDHATPYMQSCASKDLYFFIDDSTDFVNAMKNLSSTNTVARLVK